MKVLLEVNNSVMDIFGLELKAKFLGEILKNFDRNLPSYREAGIQVEKLERMVKEFDKKFRWSWQLVLGGPKMTKVQGAHKLRLDQQDKIVDGLLRKIMEEELVKQFGSGKRPKITAKKLRGAVKKLVENLNREIHQRISRTLAEVGLDAVKGIKGLHKPGIDLLGE